MFHNIPHELRAYPQWVVWRLEHRPDAEPTKVPYNPRSGYKASVTNPADWLTFDEALACGPFDQVTVFDPALPVSQTGFSGIGFVLTEGDPFGFIDLDDAHGDSEAYERQIKIFREFDSYSELSPSGNGLHTIIKGQLPAGRRRSFVEIYSKERYMTMTGNVYHQAPIAERQELFTLLFNEMGGPAVDYVYGQDQEQKLGDLEVYEQASAAENGEKFLALWGGDWRKYYGPHMGHSGEGHSEADFALINIIAFYTQNRAQIMRMFRMSQLGQRDKAQRDRYLDYMVNKSFDRQLPPVDVEGLRAQFTAIMAARAVPAYVNPASAPGEPSGNPGASPVAGEGSGVPVAQGPGVMSPQPIADAPTSHEPRAGSITFPPGLVGEVAQFILDAAPRPVPEIALAGAYGLLAGICGRAYNVSGTGVNQYVIVIAKTGRGKEAIASGISKLMGAIKASVPPSGDFVGPGEISSSPAILKWLGKTPAVFCIVGEFGLKLKEMSNANANIHLTGLKRTLLDLYNKSGKTDVLNPMAYSDREKNTVTIQSPAFTLIGESTPSRFYENLDRTVIADGLVPRFMVIDYTGPRVDPQEAHNKVNPPFALIERLASLTAHCLSLSHNGQVQDVPWTQEAKAIFDAFNKHADTQINKDEGDVETELWNRAHIKAMKLAALYAIGTDYVNPLIIGPMAQRACDEIAEQTLALKARFDQGEVGIGVEESSSEARQLAEMTRVIGEWSTGPHVIAEKYRVPFEMHRDGVFPYSSLVIRLNSQAAFRNDRAGAGKAIERAFKLLIDGDDLREMPKDQMQMKYGRRARAFVVANPAKFVGN